MMAGHTINRIAVLFVGMILWCGAAWGAQKPVRPSSVNSGIKTSQKPALPRGTSLDYKPQGKRESKGQQPLLQTSSIILSPIPQRPIPQRPINLNVEQLAEQQNQNSEANEKVTSLQRRKETIEKVIRNNSSYSNKADLVAKLREQLKDVNEKLEELGVKMPWETKPQTVSQPSLKRVSEVPDTGGLTSPHFAARDGDLKSINQFVAEENKRHSTPVKEDQKLASGTGLMREGTDPSSHSRSPSPDSVAFNAIMDEMKPEAMFTQPVDDFTNKQMAYRKAALDLQKAKRELTDTIKKIDAFTQQHKTKQTDSQLANLYFNMNQAKKLLAEKEEVLRQTESTFYQASPIMLGGGIKPSTKKQTPITLNNAENPLRAVQNESAVYARAHQTQNTPQEKLNLIDSYIEDLQQQNVTTEKIDQFKQEKTSLQNSLDNLTAHERLDETVHNQPVAKNTGTAKKAAIIGGGAVFAAGLATGIAALAGGVSSDSDQPSQEPSTSDPTDDPSDPNSPNYDPDYNPGKN